MNGDANQAAGRLDGLTVLVVGAKGSIGRACAERATQAGARVIGTGRSATAAAGDLRTLDLLAPERFDDLAKELPDLDGVVLAAGVTLVRPFTMLADSDWRRILAINLEGPMLLCRSLLRARRIRTGGSIVFVGSIAAHRGAAGYAAYAASKAAIGGAVRGLALELSRLKVRVNMISPGLITAGMAGEVEHPLTEAQKSEYAARYPLGLGSPGDVANGVLFLLSPASRWMTGADMVMDGGATLA
jgi:NAD(P)-dependent dehydrogenase (short-subunit alcohol dehydrogenase family)